MWKQQPKLGHVLDGLEEPPQIENVRVQGLTQLVDLFGCIALALIIYGFLVRLGRVSIRNIVFNIVLFVYVVEQLLGRAVAEELISIAYIRDEPGIHLFQSLVNFGLLGRKVFCDIERFGSLAELLNIRSF